MYAGRPKDEGGPTRTQALTIVRRGERANESARERSAAHGLRALPDLARLALHQMPHDDPPTRTVVPDAFDRPGQQVVLENEHCLFLQKPEPVLTGSGLIVPKAERRTVFDLTPAEWQATFDLLRQAKAHLDAEYAPDGYTVGWNCEDAGGQETFHAHLHVIPRFDDEPLAGKGLRFHLKQPGNAEAQPENH